MTSLQSVAELCWRQLYPNPSIQSPITKEEFIATARNEFAYQALLMAWKERNDEGYFEVPSYLTTSVQKEIVNNEMDISDLKILRSLPQEVWALNIGGICNCKYVKSSVNMSQLLCDDDSMDDTTKPYYFLGKKIVFPKGTHASPLTFIYANSGDGVDGLTEIDDAIGGIVRARLIDIYGGKTGVEDETTNTNSQN